MPSATAGATPPRSAEGASVDNEGGARDMSSILERIGKGDEQAVQDCISQYGGLIWSIVRRFGGLANDAEDLVQEIFLAIWKNAAKFDANKASEKTFVTMIARRRLIDRLRHIDRRPKLQSMPENAPDPANTEHTSMEMGVELAVAARCLRKLKPDQRRVIELSIYYGMSHREISEETDIPIGTVKSHIFRGLALVRKMLNEASQAGVEPGAVTP